MVGVVGSSPIAPTKHGRHRSPRFLAEPGVFSRRLHLDAAQARAASDALRCDCHVGITRQLEQLASLPPLLEPAAQARRIARDTVAFFRGAVHEHHAEEEQELFPAVLTSATRGPEREQVQVIVDRLVAEHRQIEAMWSRLEPGLKAVGKGLDAEVDAAAVQRLVDTYVGHACYEEQEFLPLSQTILGRAGHSPVTRREYAADAVAPASSSACACGC